MAVVLTCLLIADLGKAQNLEELKPYTRQDGSLVDTVIDKRVATVLLRRAGEWTSYPIIRFNSLENVIVSFDDFAGGFKTYTYGIVHCNADWTPSELPTTQVFNGLPENQVQTNRPSVNTLQRYSAYQFTWPENGPKPLLAGNYAILIYRDYDKSQAVAVRRVYVYDTRMGVSMNIRRSNISELRNSHQEVDFTVSLAGANVLRPYEQIKVYLSQNFRPDRVLTGVQPTFIRNNELVYDFEDVNSFPGGSEFRQFDIRTLRTQGLHVNRIYSDSNHRVYLNSDRATSHQSYSFVQDLNGQAAIGFREGAGIARDEDYAYVTPELLSSELPPGDIYVYGELTGWKVEPGAKLRFDSKTQSYYTRLYLKQGFYDYTYVAVDAAGGVSEVGIEGSYFQTENTYICLVYFRPIGERYDLLVGYSRTNTLNSLD